MSDEAGINPVVPASHVQWLRYLSGANPGTWRWQQPAARQAVRAIQRVAREQLKTHADAILREPLVIREKGLVREVEVLRGIRYTINRYDRSCSASLVNQDGDWEEFGPDSHHSIVVDTCLFRPAWRRRASHALRKSLRQWLSMQLSSIQSGVGNAVDSRAIEAVLEGAWHGARIERTLRAGIRTKPMRRRIHSVMGFDQEVMAMARAARLCTRKHHVTHRWFTFVWRNMETLTRIRRQTPTLLAPVAEHMFRHGTPPGEDPTRQFVGWLISRGVKRSGYLLLVKWSARPLRCVIQRWSETDALDALVMALLHAQSPSGARLPTPALYRATYDKFGPGMSPNQIMEHLAPLPAQFFPRARERAASCQDQHAFRLFLQSEYRLVLDWLLERAKMIPELPSPEGGWAAWVRSAREVDLRKRAKVSVESWPCAIAAWRTPTAEAIALATPLALFEEGCALRHCAFGYADRCNRGEVRLFSARMRHHGRIERATIGLYRAGKAWRIWDIRGACNRRLGGHWITTARELAQAYSCSEPCLQLPLPLDTTRQDGVACA